MNAHDWRLPAQVGYEYSGLLRRALQGNNKFPVHKLFKIMQLQQIQPSPMKLLTHQRDKMRIGVDVSPPAILFKHK